MISVEIKEYRSGLHTTTFIRSINKIAYYDNGLLIDDHKISFSRTVINSGLVARRIYNLLVQYLFDIKKGNLFLDIKIEGKICTWFKAYTEDDEEYKQIRFDITNRPVSDNNDINDIF